MKYYLHKVEGEALVVLQARAEGPGMRGDLVYEVREGEKAGKYTYNELVKIAFTKGIVDLKTKGEK
jgi:hypothetical protein